MPACRQVIHSIYLSGSLPPTFTVRDSRSADLVNLPPPFLLCNDQRPPLTSLPLALFPPSSPRPLPHAPPSSPVAFSLYGSVLPHLSNAAVSPISRQQCSRSARLFSTPRRVVAPSYPPGSRPACCHRCVLRHRRCIPSYCFNVGRHHVYPPTCAPPCPPLTTARSLSYLPREMDAPHRSSVSCQTTAPLADEAQRSSSAAHINTLKKENKKPFSSCKSTIPAVYASKKEKNNKLATWQKNIASVISN